MAYTPPPTPPNSGDPGPFNERMDAMLGWFPTHVADLNRDMPALLAKYWVTRTGTANAIILTGGFVALVAGIQVRFRAAAANTISGVTINLDGFGTRQCRTITGAALPIGYIRSDVDTVATYDGNNWIVDRETERGSNANGEFVRLADGTQICSQLIDGLTAPLAQGAVFTAPSWTQWTYPAVFSSSRVYVNASVGTFLAWAAGRVGTSAQTTAQVVVFATAARSDAMTVTASAYGTWY